MMKKLDELSSMYHLLVYNIRHPAATETGSVSSPLLFSPKLINEGDHDQVGTTFCYICQLMGDRGQIE